MEKNIPQQLTNKEMVGYAIGAIPVGLLAFIYSLFYVEFFYNDLKLLPIYFVTGLIIYAIVNAINDPLLGQLTDRTDRKKWGGRRNPYIKYGSIIWVLTFIMIWFPWSFDNQILIFIHFTISICAFDTMLTLVVLCWMALMPEMTTDIEVRNKINFLTLLIGLFGVIPFFLIVPGAKDTGLQQFQIVNIIIGIISIICYMIVVATTFERPEFQKDEVFPLVKSVKETVKLKSFILYIGYNFCHVFNRSIGLSYLFVYVYIFGSNSFEIMALFLLIYIILLYFSYIVCMKLRSKWGMRATILRFGILQVLGSFAVFLLLLNPNTQPLIWLGLIWTTFFGGYGVFTTTMMALSMDEDEVNQGTRREGMFLGINALFTKPAESLGPILATFILETSGFWKGFLLMKESPFQPPSALDGIKILFLLIPAVSSLISFLFMYFYPLHGERLKRLQLELEKLHKKKREKLVSNL